MGDKVSILVPTFNRRFWLPHTLNSLVNQSHRNIEIIVVNDAGEDVKDVVDKFNDSRIRYFTNEKNLDLAGTRNVALKHSTGDYIMLCDDDDQILQYGIEFRLHMMKKLNAEIVYTRALQNVMERVLDGYRIVQRNLYWDSIFNRDLILIQNICPCNCSLFSRKSWEDVGKPLFDETLTTSEDWAFWVELSRANDFHELKLIDCECSFRTDNSQMTGSREGYVSHLPYLYKKWRKYADNLEYVIKGQNKIMTTRGLNPEDYGL